MKHPPFDRMGLALFLLFVWTFGVAQLPESAAQQSDETQESWDQDKISHFGSWFRKLHGQYHLHVSKDGSHELEVIGCDDSNAHIFQNDRIAI